MDWSNRFTLGGFTVTYCTYQMAWEVIEKQGDYEVAFRWFPSKQKAKIFALDGSTLGIMFTLRHNINEKEYIYG